MKQFFQDPKKRPSPNQVSEDFSSAHRHQNAFPEPSPRSSSPGNSIPAEIESAAVSDGGGGATSAQIPQTPDIAPVVEQQATPETEQATSGRTVIVDDDARQVQAGQLRKSEFLDTLLQTIRRQTDTRLAEAGQSTANCPYIAFWFGYYRNRSAADLERAIHRYAPGTQSADSASEYISAISARVERGVSRWLETGEVTEVPPEAQALMGAANFVSSLNPLNLFRKSDNGAADSSGTPARLRGGNLGRGRPLDTKVRSTMESAMGADFSRVRMHTGPKASAMAQKHHARAFTLGNDIVFGSGEYQPGNVTGDALIAHEHAHVAQQRGARDNGNAVQNAPQSAPLETDADNSAAAVMMNMHGKKETNGLRSALPRMRSGLRMSRCDSGSSPSATALGPAKTISVDLIKLHGSNRGPEADLTKANDVYKPAHVKFSKGTSKTVDETKTKKWLGGDTELDAADDCGKVTAEEVKMFDTAKSDYSLSSRFRVFYVEDMTYDALAYSLPPYCATGPAAPYLDHAVIINGAHADTMAHEFGHILLDSGKHESIDDSSDKTNLMVSPGRTGSTLDESQKKIIYGNA